MGEQSFSSTAKAELCRDKITGIHCALAEAYGLLLFCNTFLSSEIRIVTTSQQVAKRLPKLFRRAFQFSFDQQPEAGASSGKYSFVINDPQKLLPILDAYGYQPEQLLSHHINYAVLEEDGCPSAFLKGAFLAGGSISDPRKRYQLELSTSHYWVSRELQPLMAELDMAPKTVTRGANYVTYFKRSEAIADFLTAIGAPVAAMEIMNTKLEKNIYNKVNRRSNCDMANLDKAVSAAQKQISQIQTLQDNGAWEALPEQLKQTGNLRLQYPELSLSQLAELAGVSKSCLNHRLRKLTELASADREE